MSSYHTVPPPSDPLQLSKGYGPRSQAHLATAQTDTADFAQGGHQSDLYAMAQRHSQSPAPAPESRVSRSASRASTLHVGDGPSRSGTLKKKSSVRRSRSKKSIARSGSVQRAPDLDGYSQEEYNSVFHTPIPTTGTPTDILADRFQAWRKLLKDLINYFREIQNSYEQRSKALLKVSHATTNISAPSILISEGGLHDAILILTEHSKQALFESNKSRDIMNDVATQLSGLRSDLNQKVKEIKGLSGDFKNSVDKEKEATKKAVLALRDALDVAETDPRAGPSAGDPYIIRMAVERQVERQIDEENYLHRAYLNLESSGRELEAIVVGEIQKAYNAYAGTLKREADAAYNAVEGLREGPIAMPRDLEWNKFVEYDPHFVNPRLPLRRVEEIVYPGKHHPAAAEIRAGMLERKSKYLKSYTPGWYVLSPTHLHEFKSAERIYTQPPVMSLYLPDQKLGSHSQPNSSSHKFMLKGRQTGSLHRGHSWVFRAESYDTMLAWYSDIKNLTEKSGQERVALVRKHARSVSAGSQKTTSFGSSEDVMEADEADEVPYSAVRHVSQGAKETPPQRPQPGGRFPSDLQLKRRSQVPLSLSSGSSDNDRDVLIVPTAVSVSDVQRDAAQESSPTRDAVSARNGISKSSVAGLAPPTQLAQEAYAAHTTQARQPVAYHEGTAPMIPAMTEQPAAGSATDPSHQPGLAQRFAQPAPSSYTAYPAPQQDSTPIPSTTNTYSSQSYPSQLTGPTSGVVHQDSSSYGEWLAPAGGGAAAGILGTEAYRRHDQREEPSQSLEDVDDRRHQQREEPSQSPAETSSAMEMARPAKPSATVYFHGDFKGPAFYEPVTFAQARALPTERGHGSDGSNEPQPAVGTSANGETMGSSGGITGKEEPIIDTHPHVSTKSPTDVRPTGHIFPAVMRHNTGFSVSDLHVPGEFPPTPR